MPPTRKVGVPFLPDYERHQPEQTLLYQVMEQYYPIFKEHLASQGKSLPMYVQQVFEDCLRCGRSEQGFLRVRCDDCHHERLASAAPWTSVASAGGSVGGA